MAATTLAIVGLAGSVVSGVAQMSAQRKAARASQRAAQEQQRAQQAQYRRSQRQAIRRAQVARARAMATAAGAGALQTSGASGGIGSISSQLGSGLGYGTMQAGISQNISNYQTQSARYSSRAQMWGDVGSAFGSVASLGIQNGGLNFLFDNQQPQQPAIPQYAPD